jgi:hypothetical protein
MRVPLEVQPVMRVRTEMSMGLIVTAGKLAV